MLCELREGKRTAGHVLLAETEWQQLEIRSLLAPLVLMLLRNQPNLHPRTVGLALFMWMAAPSTKGFIVQFSCFTFECKEAQNETGIMVSL